MRITVAAAAVLLATASSSWAGVNAGYFRVEGVQGPAKAQGYVGWFDMSSHDLTIADEAPQCTLVVEVNALHRATDLAELVGTEVPEVELELVGFHQERSYEIRATDVLVRKLVTSSDAGVQHEMLEMKLGHGTLRTWKIDPTGQVSGVSQRALDCGSR